MHLIGTHLSGTIERPPARAPTRRPSACEWRLELRLQRTYLYDTSLDTLPERPKDDVIDVSALVTTRSRIRSNSARSRTRVLVAPVDVSLGEGSRPTRCVSRFFGVATDAPAQPFARTTPRASDLPPLDVVGGCWATLARETRATS